MSLLEFLNLGEQPLANGFVCQEQLNDPEFTEFTFNLQAGFNESNYLVSLMEFVDPARLFDDQYAYHSSGSQTMRDHFKKIAEWIRQSLRPRRVLEIGSNDGVFLRHFPTDVGIAVEPCGNFAEITREAGYPTYNEFWTIDLANEIRDRFGTIDVVYAANCMCHIPKVGPAFGAIEHVLADDGVFIFEDPALDKMLVKNAYDQIYDEHAHLFSVIALQHLLDRNDLAIWCIDHLSVHGGSHRVYTKKILSNRPIEASVDWTIADEFDQSLECRSTFTKFAQRVRKSRRELVELLQRLKNDGKKIIGYGATSKSTIIYNYCQIGPDLIDCVTDTTPGKQGMYMPGVHIPIVAPEEGMNASVDYAFLGAWNYGQEVLKKEAAFLNRGGKFITHVPHVRII